MLLPGYLSLPAGLAGEGLAAWLQNPWVLGAFALLLVGFSLSMFGFYELQLPERWRDGLQARSGGGLGGGGGEKIGQRRGARAAHHGSLAISRFRAEMSASLRVMAAFISATRSRYFW